ncbi:MAG: hypothetical protein Q4F83_13245 [Eubacteriales bacterium]|nr:hypothetical protein [Eubacteriales bacterium]
MRKQKFAIFDLEASYACNLMEYMAERQSVPFETLVFSSMESLEKYTKENILDLLMVSERMMSPELRQMNIRRIIILSEGAVSEEFQDYPAVYKYQSSESLVAEVMSYYAKQEVPQPRLLKKRAAQIIGVYSPIGRCGKTCFALTLGQILAQKKPVLYLNLEDYAGFSFLMEKEGMSDISDVMYFLRQHKGNAIFKVNSALQRLGSMDYVSPAFSSGDLREIKAEEWVRLLDELISCSNYETIILDIGHTVDEVSTLLMQCTHIYTPICTDVISMAKMNQYEQLLREMEYEEILQKTHKLGLPFCAPAMQGEYFMEQLANGEMGDYVRKMLQQEIMEDDR